jgi:hypothetical protein
LFCSWHHTVHYIILGHLKNQTRSWAKVRPACKNGHR